MKGPAMEGEAAKMKRSDWATIIYNSVALLCITWLITFGLYLAWG